MAAGEAEANAVRLAPGDYRHPVIQPFAGNPDAGLLTTEIERYMAMPGQACAYKVGQLKILALRDKARQALGDRFDLKAFHKVILENGAVPLTVLERLVDDWIAREKAQRAA